MCNTRCALGDECVTRANLPGFLLGREEPHDGLRLGLRRGPRAPALAPHRQSYTHRNTRYNNRNATAGKTNPCSTRRGRGRKQTLAYSK
eukprot:600854-Pyramimonas_sp.AAC.1